MGPTVFKRIVSLTISIGGCGPQKERDLAACQVETLRLYPRDTDSSGEDNGRRFIFRTACMKAKGYTLARFSGPGCSFAEELSLQVACYEADGLIGGFLEELTR
jgi:hypothetical protein